MESGKSRFESINTHQLPGLVRQGAIPLDVRNKNDFSAGFIPGSIFMGSATAIRHWKPALIAENAAILITDEGFPPDIEEYNYLFADSDNVYLLEGGMKAWEKSGGDIDMIIEIDTEELTLDLKFDKKILLLDLREPDLYAREHIEGAVNLPLGELRDIAQIAGVDEDVNLYLYDESPVNSLISASIFKRHGYQHLRVIHQKWSLIKEYKELPLVSQRKKKENP